MGRRTIWITGASGFSGQHLSRFLRALSEPPYLVGIDLRPAAPEGLDLYRQFDLTDVSALRELVGRHPPDGVIHLAGLLPPAAEADLWRVNVGGTLKLLQALATLIKSPKVRVVTVGSAAEYLRSSARLIGETDPAGGETPYGWSKWAQSALALAFGAQVGIEVVVARTFNLIGPGIPATLVPGALCAQFACNGHRKIKVGNLRPKRDFIDIRDAVSAYWKICEKGRPGSIYNVCTGRATSIETVVNLFSRFAPGHRMVERDISRSRRGDLARVCGDNARLRRLGWTPAIPLEQSIRDMLEWAGGQRFQ